MLSIDKVGSTWEIFTHSILYCIEKARVGNADTWYRKINKNLAIKKIVLTCSRQAKTGQAKPLFLLLPTGSTTLYKRAAEERTRAIQFDPVLPAYDGQAQGI